MAGRLDAELPGRSAFGDPARKHAVRDQLLPARPRSPSASNGARAQPARAQRIVDDRHAGANTCCPSLSCRKLVLRATATPAIAPAKWPSSEPATRGSNSTGYLPGLDARRVEPGDGALAGAAADRLRPDRGRRDGGRCARRGRAASPRLRRRPRRRDAVAGRAVSAREPARRRQRDDRCRRARPGTAGVGYAGDRERRILRFQRPGAKLGGVRLALVLANRGTAARRASAAPRGASPA